ncbi:hypothetical protein IWW50_003144, partial [Coemansia erecta]
MDPRCVGATASKAKGPDAVDLDVFDNLMSSDMEEPIAARTLQLQRLQQPTANMLPVGFSELPEDLAAKRDRYFAW